MHVRHLQVITHQTIQVPIGKQIHDPYVPPAAHWSIVSAQKERLASAWIRNQEG